MPTGGMTFTGKWRSVTTAPDGTVLHDSGWNPNVVTDYAATTMLQWACGKNNTGWQPLPPPTKIELGTGTGTPESTDTDLFAPVAATLQSASIAGPASDNVGTWVFQFYGTSANAGTYSEGGMKDSQGNLWTHSLSSTEISEGNTTTCTWTITASV